MAEDCVLMFIFFGYLQHVSEVHAPVLRQQCASHRLPAPDKKLYVHNEISCPKLGVNYYFLMKDISFVFDYDSAAWVDFPVISIRTFLYPRISLFLIQS